MLDSGDVPEIDDFDWEGLALKARLPSNEPTFFQRRGACGMRSDCRRSRARLYLRSVGILQRGDGTRLGVYTADVSAKGVRLLSPVQLFPKDCCLLRLPTTRKLPIEITRCRRLESQCYECGAEFITGAINVKADGSGQ
jgi:hypothetical protein